jgi:hypothetical protein
MDKGDILIAFIYNIRAMVSNGSNVNTARKKWMSNLGISMNGKSKSKKGVANPARTQAIRYSLLSASDFLQRASADAVKKAQSRDRKNQSKANHWGKYKILKIFYHSNSKFTINTK